jgi:hypothetical protein
VLLLGGTLLSIAFDFERRMPRYRVRSTHPCKQRKDAATTIYRSGEPLRHPKAKPRRSFSVDCPPSRKKRGKGGATAPNLPQCRPRGYELSRRISFAMKKNVLRAVIEVGFIIFLFYSNLLMGEFERSGQGQKRGVVWALEDVFTAANFEIAMVAALCGYILFEFLRKRF